MTFYVGQRVVCVKRHEVHPDAGFEYPPIGSVHTIREIGRCHIYGKLGLRLERFILPLHPDGIEFLLHPHCFRPVVERKTDISIFTAMLDKVKA